MEHPSAFTSTTRAFLNESRLQRGRMRIGLTVDAGAYYVWSLGRLRAYSHRYRYTIRNTDLNRRDLHLITRFSIPYCPGSALKVEPPTLLDGTGNPSTWTVNFIGDESAAHVDWKATAPFLDGIGRESEWAFVLYTNSEPDLGFVSVDGGYYPAEGTPEETNASLLYWVPGCAAESSAGVAELNWEAAVDTASAPPGTLLNYTLRATNVGTGTAFDAVILDTLPSSVTYVPGTTTLNGTPVPDPSAGLPPFANGLIVPRIPPGASAVVRFQVRVNRDASAPRIENRASITLSPAPPLASAAAVTTLLPLDTTPPTVTIASPGMTVYRKPESFDPVSLTFQFTVTDASPGLDPSSVRVTLDGVPITSGEVRDLFDLRPGRHELRIQATDWAGNKADVVHSFTVVATIRSTMYEVVRMERMGWFRTWRTTAALNRPLEGALMRLAAGDRAGARAGVEAFLRAATDAFRRTEPRPLLPEAAVAQLEATGLYLLENL